MVIHGALALFSQGLRARIRSALGAPIAPPVGAEPLLRLVAVGRSSRAEILETLGTPDRDGEDALCYTLPDFPGVLFSFELDEDGRLLRTGFTRDGDAPALPALQARGPDPDELSALRAHAPTLEELETAYGPSELAESWWPSEERVFAPGWALEIIAGRLWDRLP